MKSTHFKHEPMGDVVNIPITEDEKTLLICISRVRGFHRHTPVARALLRTAMYQAVKEMTPEERTLLDKIAASTRIANNIEKVMLNELQPD